MRAHYVRALRAAKERGVTQQMVAAAGGLKNQNYVSKIKTAPRLGPAVEIFIRGIEGLGKPVSEFFAELEGRQPEDRERQADVSAAPVSHEPADRAFIIEAIIDTLQRGAAAPNRTPRRRRRHR